MTTAVGIEQRTRRLAWWLLGLSVLVGAVYLMATAETGPVDPTEVAGEQSRGTVVFSASMIVFRGGLGAGLILAAITASFVGIHAPRRRPVILGAAVSFGATVVTWFVV